MPTSDLPQPRDMKTVIASTMRTSFLGFLFWKLVGYIITAALFGAFYITVYPIYAIVQLIRGKPLNEFKQKKQIADRLIAIPEEYRMTIAEAIMKQPQEQWESSIKEVNANAGKCAAVLSNPSRQLRNAIQEEKRN